MYRIYSLLCVLIMAGFIVDDSYATVTATEVQECKNSVNQEWASMGGTVNGVPSAYPPEEIASYNAAISRCDSGVMILFRTQYDIPGPGFVGIQARLISESLIKPVQPFYTVLPTAYKLTFDKNLDPAEPGSPIRLCRQHASYANNHIDEFESRDITCGGIPLAYKITQVVGGDTYSQTTYSPIAGYSYPANYSSTIPIYRCKDTSNTNWDLALVQYYNIVDTWLTHNSNCGNGRVNTTYPGVTNLGIYAWGFAVSASNYQ